VIDLERAGEEGWSRGDAVVPAADRQTVPIGTI
jgi:hypothetical protein